mmetsp:Transcript_4293/g.15446  ORF Transcript_4293/g.15446 Transcript_4293/m.15446 type:complete len:205 (+) Transcript_4293:299-913(+)
MSASKDFKVVLLGEGRVGKTSLVLRYVKDEFTDNRPPTCEASFLSKRLTVDGQPCNLNIWDTAGQERFHALGPIYYRDADAALLVYDITDTESFDRVKAWVKELRSMAGKDIIITLAANKCDLEKNRQVSTEDGERYANSIDAQIFNTSAKLNKGVEQAFLNVTRRLVTKSRSNSGAGASGYGNKKSLLIVEDKPDKPKSSSCC